MAIASGSDRLTSWRIDELLLRQPGLRIVPADSDLVFAGTLEVNAQVPGKAAIRDMYEIQLRIPLNFPQKVPVVFETGGRIPRSYHRLQDGSLCLASETRLRLLLAEGLSLVAFVERCVVPYLYRYSYLKTYGEAPFGDLAHGAEGIREDLRLLFGVDQGWAVLPFVRLVAMKKKHANKRSCPCGSGRRLGRCHNRLVNRLRDRLGRYWFRIVEQQLLRGSSALDQHPPFIGSASQTHFEQRPRPPIRQIAADLSERSVSFQRIGRLSQG